MKRGKFEEGESIGLFEGSAERSKPYKVGSTLVKSIGLSVEDSSSLSVSEKGLVVSPEGGRRSRGAWIPFTSGNNVPLMDGVTPLMGLQVSIFSISSKLSLQSLLVFGLENSSSESECFPRQPLKTVFSSPPSTASPASQAPPSSLTTPTLSTSLPKSAVSTESSSTPVDATRGLRSDSNDPSVFTLMGVGGLCGERERPPSLKVLQIKDSTISSCSSMSGNGGSSLFIM